MSGFEKYEKALDGLPGIESYQWVASTSGHDRSFDGRLTLHTEAGPRDLLVQIFRSHLTQKTADHLVAAATLSADPILVFAPRIGAGLAGTFSKAGLNYIDANGNCHISAPPLYVHIEGKSSPPRRSADKGLRRAGYQVLFAYLAQPPLLDATIREVAEVAGVSRQPVADMRHRLLEDEYVLATKTRTRWHPRRQPDALALWLHGYETTVRPSLVLGTYRTRDANPALLERSLARALAETGVSDFRWGGSAAGFRITGHYRGERTVVHVKTAPRGLPTQLQSLPDPRGNLILMDAFGTLNWEPETDTAHPLLVYSEMLNEGTERAREAAAELYAEHLQPVWEQER